MTAPLRVAVITTGAGQGSTTFAAGLGWSAAEGARTVCLLDADPAVGTMRTLFDLDGRASLENALGSTGISTAALEGQALRIGARPGLRVVPGFRRWELRSSQVIARLGPALALLPDDVVIADIGCPFEPGDGGGPPAVVQLAAHFDAILVVIRAQADLLERAIRLLDGIPLTRTRLVIARPPQRREMPAVLTLLREQLPALAAPLEWDWDHNRVLRQGVTGVPMHRPRMLEETGLTGAGESVPVARRPGLLARLLPRRSAP